MSVPTCFSSHLTSTAPLPYEVLPGPWPLPLFLTHYKYKIYFFSHQRNIRTLTTHQLSPLQVFALQAATLGPERTAGRYGNVSGRLYRSDGAMAPERQL